jgi:hypothetical protein
MVIRIHPHASERMEERGATIDEVCSTIEQGESFPAKFGRTGFRRNFVFDSQFRGKYYFHKQLELYAVFEEGGCLVITVITRFF